MVLLACGWRHTLLGLANGDVFSWGRGVNGQLGHNEQRDLCAPPFWLTGPHPCQHGLWLLAITLIDCQKLNLFSLAVCSVYAWGELPALMLCLIQSLAWAAANSYAC